MGQGEDQPPKELLDLPAWQGEEARELEDLRISIARSLADLDRKEGVTLLRMLLKDEDEYVRSAAALALTESSHAEAIDGLVEAIEVNYDGKDTKVTRNPNVHAHIVRFAGIRASGDERLGKVKATAGTSKHPDVQFIGGAVQ